MPAGENLLLYVPRDVLPRAVHGHLHTADIALGEWQAGILAAHIAALARTLPSTPDEGRCVLAHATQELVRNCLESHAPARSVADKPAVIALRERARRVVRQNMAHADFGPGELGQLLSVSRSKLYRVFERSGGVARFIQQERLAEAHERLTTAAMRIPIHELAAELGFSDHSAFSRSFRLVYGFSPSEAREFALANRLLDPESQAASEGAGLLV